MQNYALMRSKRFFHQIFIASFSSPFCDSDGAICAVSAEDKNNCFINKDVEKLCKNKTCGDISDDSVSESAQELRLSSLIKITAKIQIS